MGSGLGRKVGADEPDYHWLEGPLKEGCSSEGDSGRWMSTRWPLRS